MDYQLIFLLIVTIFSEAHVHCFVTSKSNSFDKARDNGNSEIWHDILKRVEALEEINLGKIVNLEMRVNALEKHFPSKNDRNVESEDKKKAKLNDMSDLEERVHALELGLTAVADNLDELQESQVIITI